MPIVRIADRCHGRSRPIRRAYSRGLRRSRCDGVSGPYGAAASNAAATTSPSFSARHEDRFPVGSHGRLWPSSRRPPTSSHHAFQYGVAFGDHVRRSAASSRAESPTPSADSRPHAR
jgi:hypothetical protein